MPTRCPVVFLTRIAAVPGAFALRANSEVLQMSHNLAPVIAAIRRPLQRYSAALVELVGWIRATFTIRGRLR